MAAQMSTVNRPAILQPPHVPMRGRYDKRFAAESDYFRQKSGMHSCFRLESAHLTVIVTLAMFESAVPSFARNVNESTPEKLRGGVQLKVPSGLKVSAPFFGGAAGEILRHSDRNSRAVAVSPIRAPSVPARVRNEHHRAIEQRRLSKLGNTFRSSSKPMRAGWSSEMSRLVISEALSDVFDGKVLHLSGFICRLP